MPCGWRGSVAVAVGRLPFSVVLVVSVEALRFTGCRSCSICIGLPPTVDVWWVTSGWGTPTTPRRIPRRKVPEPPATAATDPLPMSVGPPLVASEVTVMGCRCAMGIGWAVKSRAAGYS